MERMEKEAGLTPRRALLFAKKASSSSPSCTTPKARKPAMVKSVTRDEIDRYWRMRRMIEEDHLLAAQKAAARIRAKALKEEDYRRFEDSLMEMLNDRTDESRKDGEVEAGAGDDNNEIWIGVKDWWTKSKFAYLNQPAIKSAAENATPKRPQQTCSGYFSPPRQLHNTSSFGVF